MILPPDSCANSYDPAVACRQKSKLGDMALREKMRSIAAACSILDESRNTQRVIRILRDFKIESNTHR